MKTKIAFFGPTNFSSLIHKAADMARDFQTDNRGYLILLILTDGEITDMDRTIGEIVEASVLPLSIVIVGIGNANFENMNILDADDEPLVANGKTMSRDIVQFVPYRNYKQDSSRLAEDVLQEIPGQLVGYMKSKGIKPSARQFRSQDQFLQSNANLLQMANNNQPQAAVQPFNPNLPPQPYNPNQGYGMAPNQAHLQNGGAGMSNQGSQYNLLSGGVQPFNINQPQPFNPNQPRPYNPNQAYAMPPNQPQNFNGGVLNQGSQYNLLSGGVQPFNPNQPQPFNPNQPQNFNPNYPNSSNFRN